MTAVSLEDSRRYALWLSIKVIGALLAGVFSIIFGGAVVGDALVNGYTEWYVPWLGAFMVIAGVLGLFATFLGALYKLIADSVEMGIVSAQDLEKNPVPGFELSDIWNRIR